MKWRLSLMMDCAYVFTKGVLVIEGHPYAV